MSMSRQMFAVGIHAAAGANQSLLSSFFSSKPLKSIPKSTSRIIEVDSGGSAVVQTNGSEHTLTSDSQDLLNSQVSFYQGFKATHPSLTLSTDKQQNHILVASLNSKSRDQAVVIDIQTKFSELLDKRDEYISKLGETDCQIVYLFFLKVGNNQTGSGTC